MTKTMTFEELFEEVKKLYVFAKNPDYSKNSIYFNCKQKNDYEIKKIEKKYQLRLWIDDCFATILETKDPNKILELIKCLKEMEDE